MPLPCRRFSPASAVSQLDESTITGTRAMSGSVAARSRKAAISFVESSNASSMFTSMPWAPASTWSRAMSTASDRAPSRIRRANLREPATLVRSPTLKNRLSGPRSNASRPERCVMRSFSPANTRTGAPSSARAMARIWSGVLPQQPPAMLRPTPGTLPAPGARAALDMTSAM